MENRNIEINPSVKAIRSISNQVLKHSFLSRKFWMTLFGIGVVWLIYWHSINYLYSFTSDAQITAFNAMYTSMLWVVGTVVLSYLGVNGLTSWKHGTSVSNVVETIGSHIRSAENKPSDIEEDTNIPADSYCPRPPKEKVYSTKP